MTDEWAVRIRQDLYSGAEHTQVGAFQVKKATPKTLIGEVLYLRQHPIEDCIRGLTENKAKALAADLGAQIEFSKGVIRREQDAIRQAIKESREIWNVVAS